MEKELCFLRNEKRLIGECLIANAQSSINY